MRCVLAAIGSRGDTQPFLALARRLSSDGHEVVVAVPPDSVGDFEGFEAHALGVDVRQFLTENAAKAHDNPLGAFSAAFGLLVGSLREQYELLRPLCEGADRLIGTGLLFGGPSAAEAAGVPFRMVFYCPQLLPSDQHGPVEWPWGGLPPWVNRLGWWVHRLVGHVGVRELNRFRREVGLPPVADIHEAWRPRGRTLLACDPDLSPAPRDVDPDVAQFGFWHLEQPDELPSDVEAFLDEGPAVYVGFGSMPDPTPEKTAALIDEAVALSGVRALVSSGWAGLRTRAPGAMTLGPCSHAALFPRLAGVLHHGGSGTTAAAALAGTPQAAIPHLLDQHYWCRRLAWAGLGPPGVRRSRLDAPTLAALLTDLASGRHRERAAEWSQRLRSRDGLGSSVEWLLG